MQKILSRWALYCTPKSKNPSSQTQYSFHLFLMVIGQQVQKIRLSFQQADTQYYYAT